MDSFINNKTVNQLHQLVIKISCILFVVNSSILFVNSTFLFVNSSCLLVSNCQVSSIYRSLQFVNSTRENKDKLLHTYLSPFDMVSEHFHKGELEHYPNVTLPSCSLHHDKIWEFDVWQLQLLNSNHLFWTQRPTKSFHPSPLMAANVGWGTQGTDSWLDPWMVGGTRNSYDSWHLDYLRVEFDPLISNGDGRRRL